MNIFLFCTICSSVRNWLVWPILTSCSIQFMVFHQRVPISKNIRDSRCARWGLCKRLWFSAHLDSIKRTKQYTELCYNLDIAAHLKLLNLVDTKCPLPETDVLDLSALQAQELLSIFSVWEILTLSIRPASNIQLFADIQREQENWGTSGTTLHQSDISAPWPTHTDH
jgi:hypothetical protein